ncbi:hypothetical protein HJFPF1_04162 [Paramyrothecium foliicola]|nr:hypothetical protein HJFPF1_04162 [Paramyrothecium foliicola]
MAPSNTQATTHNTSHKGQDRCPACGHRDNPIIVSTASPSALTIFILIAFCLSCACCLLTGARISVLAFYCERCGLRLINEENASSRLKYDSSSLIAWPSEVGKPPSVRQVSALKAALSPLGLPPPVHRPYVVDISKRYHTLKPTQIFNIETGLFKLPTKASSTAGPSVSYLVEAPGIPTPNPASKLDPQYLQNSCAWSLGSYSSYQNPHFRVISQSADGSRKEVAHIQLFRGENWDAEILSSCRSRGEGGNDEGKLSYGKPSVTRRMLAEDEAAWSTSRAGVLWASSGGIVLWSERKIEDGDGAKGKFLCLLDAYDRLIIALRKEKGKTWQMRVYSDLSEDFLGEILASYTAIRCQQERIRQEHIFDSS